MATNISLSNTDFGVKVGGYAYNLRQEGYTNEARWASIELMPKKEDGRGNYDGSVTLTLDERTIRALAKRLAGYVEQFDFEIAEIIEGQTALQADEADEADEADGE